MSMTLRLHKLRDSGFPGHSLKADKKYHDSIQYLLVNKSSLCRSVRLHQCRVAEKEDKFAKNGERGWKRMDNVTEKLEDIKTKALIVPVTVDWLAVVYHL